METQPNYDTLVTQTLFRIKNNTKVTDALKEVAHSYKVPIGTLTKRYYNSKKAGKIDLNKQHANRKLTKTEEWKLLHLICGFSWAKSGFALKHVIEVVKYSFDNDVSHT